MSAVDAVHRGRFATKQEASFARLAPVGVRGGRGGATPNVNQSGRVVRVWLETACFVRWVGSISPLNNVRFYAVTIHQRDHSTCTQKRTRTVGRRQRRREGRRDVAVAQRRARIRTGHGGQRRVLATATQ